MNIQTYRIIQPFIIHNSQFTIHNSLFTCKRLPKVKFMPAPSIIMIVDDDKDTCELISLMLHKVGWETVTAENGIAGLALLEIHQPTLIILDLMMSKMDGFDFTKHLQLHSIWQTIPIIVLTSKYLTQQDYQRLQGHVIHIFQKGSYRQEEFLKIINRLMKKKPSNLNAV